MLHSVEILPGARRSLRRAVAFEAQLAAAPWEAPRKHRVIDLSPEGMRIAAGTCLPRQQRVHVRFTPPGWWWDEPLRLWARVARSEPRDADGPALMGLEFMDMPPGLHDRLARALRGRPPPLPTKRRAIETELVWIDVLLTYTEDLGDRINIFEVSELVCAETLEKATLSIEALAPFLTGGLCKAA